MASTFIVLDCSQETVVEQFRSSTPEEDAQARAHLRAVEAREKAAQRRTES